MRYRVVFLAGLGIGFVIGTRAGRERYEQMRRLARKVADNPSVQQAAGVLQAQAAGYAKTAGGKVADRAGVARAKAAEALHEHVPGMRVRDSNGQPATGENGQYAQTPGAADNSPGG
jgi:DNA-binding transcriptional MocR family regulator